MSVSPESAGPGALARNILHFGRALRAAGLPIGTGRIIEAVRAAEAAGVRRREDFYWALHAALVSRHDHSEVFGQAFHVFWRDPELLDKMMALVLPSTIVPRDERQNEPRRRVAEALLKAPSDSGDELPVPEIEIDASMTYSRSEVLRKKDFEEMSLAEQAEAKAALSRLRLGMGVPTRRFRPRYHGERVDLRATMRMSRRTGGMPVNLQWRSRVLRPPPLVILCDISGSMSQYSRMFLHFMHGITSAQRRVHCFVFGTRLSNITRQLRTRDVDSALEVVANTVEDWGGGTRIGETLRDFNKVWSRRVLGQGAVVVLMTDGLDRDAGEGLAPEAERLQKSCRRLIWLNPLLRYDGFEPKSKGIRAILPYVDEFRPVHNMESISALVDALNSPNVAHSSQSERQALAGLRGVVA